MAHRGRKSNGQFKKASRGGGTKSKKRRSGGTRTVVNETIRISAPSGSSRRAGRGGRFRVGARRAVDALAKETWPLMALSAAAGYVDGAYFKYLNPANRKEGDIQTMLGSVVSKIPRIGPFGWKAIVGAGCWLVSRSNRRNRWWGRAATTLLNIESYGFGLKQSGANVPLNSALLGNGAAPTGGTFPAG